jgi:hypothetical protein
LFRCLCFLQLHSKLFELIFTIESNCRLISTDTVPVYMSNKDSFFRKIRLTNKNQIRVSYKPLLFPPPHSFYLKEGKSGLLPYTRHNRFVSLGTRRNRFVSLGMMLAVHICTYQNINSSRTHENRRFKKHAPMFGERTNRRYCAHKKSHPFLEETRASLSLSLQSK